MGIVTWRGHGQPVQLRIYRAQNANWAELTLEHEAKRTTLCFRNPSPLSALIDVYLGIDSLEVCDRDREDGFHRDFGRYRVEYFIDAKFSFDADTFVIEQP